MWQEKITSIQFFLKYDFYLFFSLFGFFDLEIMVGNCSTKLEVEDKRAYPQKFCSGELKQKKEKLRLVLLMKVLQFYV